MADSPDIAVSPGRRWLRAAGWTAALLALIVTAALAFFATAPGRQTLAGLLNALLSNRQTGQAVHIGHIGGSPYGHFTVDEIVLADRAGVWLTLRGIDAEWSPLDLVVRRVTLQRLIVDRAELARLPESNAPRNRFENPIPSLPVDLRLAEGRVEHFSLKGMSRSGRLTAQLGLARGQTGATRINFRVPDADQITLVLEYGRDDRIFLADGRIDAPADGMVSRLFFPGQRWGLHGALSGRGPIDNWKGQFSLRRDDGLSVTADLATMGRQAITWQALVTADADAVLPPDWAKAGAGRITADVRLAFKPNQPPQIFAMIDNPQGHAELAVLPGADSASFKLASRDLSGLAAILGGVDLGAVSVEGSARDLTGTPAVRLAFTAEHVATPLAAMARFEGEAEMKGRTGGAMDLSARGWMRALGRGGDVSWSLDGAWTGDRARLDRLKLSGRPIEATAKGALGAGLVDVTFAAQLPDLRLLNARRPLAGAIKLDGRVAAGRGKPVDVAIQGRGSDLALGEAMLDPMLAGATTLNITARRAAGQGDIALRQASLKTPALELDVRGRLNERTRTLALDYRLDMRDGGKLTIGPDIQGGVTLAGTVGGGFDSPRVTGRAGLDQMQIEQVVLQKIAVSFDLADSLTAPVGPVRLTAQAKSGPISVEADLRGTAAWPVNIPALSLRMPGGGLSGHLSRHAWSAPFVGQIVADFKSLSLPALMAGVAADGAATGVLDLSEAEPPGGGAAQGVKFRLDASNLGQLSGHGPVLAVKTLTASGEAVWDESLDWRVLNVDARRLRRGELALETATARLAADGAFSAHAGGRFQAPLTLDLAGTVRRRDGVRIVRLSSLTGEVLKRQIRLARPAEAKLSDGATVVEGVSLAVGDGGIEASFQQDNANLAADLRVTALDLALASLAAPDFAADGQMSGEASLRRRAGRVTAHWDARIEGLRPQLTTRSREAALQLTSQGQLTESRFDASARLSNGPGTRMDLAFGVPVRRSAGGWPELAENGPFRLVVNGKMDLAKLSKLLPHSDHRFSGAADVALRGAGTLAEPGLTGSITWTGGRYEHGASGFLADQIAAQIELAGRTLDLQHFSATDGDKGRLSAFGRLTLDSRLRLTGDLKAEAQNARLLKRRDVTLWGSGQIAYHRGVDQALASGALRIDRAEAELGDDTPPEIVELQVIDINGYAMSNRAQAAEMAFPTALELDLSTTGPVFVRGYGLDSVWRGRLHVGGTASRPVLTGDLASERGVFEFIGKRFVIENGALSFTGNVPIDPDLNIRAQYEGPDITAIVELTGPASGPDIKLSSSPALPTDEILSRALFGTTTDKLTPLEAVRLGQALAGFGRKRGGLGSGIFGAARRGLGLDGIDIRTNGDNTPIFSGEKYIGKDLYLQVETGTEPGTTAATIAYAISRHLTLESTATSSNKSSLRIRWKKDY